MSTSKSQSKVKNNSTCQLYIMTRLALLLQNKPQWKCSALLATSLPRLNLGGKKGREIWKVNLKTKGTPRCRKLQFNNDWHSDHQDPHCTWTNRLQDSTSRNKYSLYKSITYIYSHTSIYTYIYIYLYMYIHRYTHTHIHICTYIYLHTLYIHVHVYIYIHTCFFQSCSHRFLKWATVSNNSTF